MVQFVIHLSLLLLSSLSLLGTEDNDSIQGEGNFSQAPVNSQKSAYVIPIREQIGLPILDILRRGMKYAIEQNVDLVVLDMDTPGGELGVTLEIMQEILDAFGSWEGKILTYVNKEAISAGAYIAIATQEIAFAPYSQIGAAEAVSGGGTEIDPSMKRKINSYLKAKIRNFAGSYKYRSQIMSAMMDANVSLVIEGEPLRAADGSLIKKAGELLTLTGEEAVKTYGTPPQPLLGIGVFQSIEDLLNQRWGANQYQLIKMEINWAEEIGLWLNGVAPLLLSVGLVLLFIEFKTPGFGIFGGLGIGFILVFFASKYVAGLAGQEELLLFLVGVCLVLVEIFLAPGLFLPAMLGLALIFGSLIWAMADIWPGQEITWSIGLFKKPLVELAQSLGLAFILGYFAVKLIGKTPLGKSMILEKSIDGGANDPNTNLVIPDSFAHCITELYPSGKVDVGGHLFDARSNSGRIERGARVRVVKQTAFELVVEKLK